MTEITIDSRLILLCILLLIWVFSWGVYIQSLYNISSVKIPTNSIHVVLGLIMGGLIVHLYYWYKGGGNVE